MIVDFFNLCIGRINDDFLLFRNLDIGHGDRNPSAGGIRKAEFFDFVQNIGCQGIAEPTVALRNQFAQFLLVHQTSEHRSIRTVLLELFRQRFVKDVTAQRCRNQPALRDTNPNFLVQSDESEVIGLQRFIAAGKSPRRQPFLLQALAFRRFAFNGQVIRPQNHILRG